MIAYLLISRSISLVILSDNKKVFIKIILLTLMWFCFAYLWNYQIIENSPLMDGRHITPLMILFHLLIIIEAILLKTNMIMYININRLHQPLLWIDVILILIFGKSNLDLILLITGTSMILLALYLRHKLPGYCQQSGNTSNLDIIWNLIIIISVFPIFSVLSSATMVYNQFNLNFVDYLAIGVVYTALILGYIYQKILYDEKGLNQQLESLEHYSEAVNQSFTYIQQYHSDFEAAILDSVEAIDQVIEDYKDYHYQYMNLLQGITDLILKGLLSQKLNTVIDSDIQLKLDIETPNTSLEIADIDKTRIIGILLDNAMEAALDTDKKEVILVLKEDPSRWQLVISNTYGLKPDMTRIDAFGYSEKGQGRGIGLYTVSQLCKKNKALSIQTKISRDYFSQTLTIQKH